MSEKVRFPCETSVTWKHFIQNNNKQKSKEYTVKYLDQNKKIEYSTYTLNRNNQLKDNWENSMEF